MVQMPGVLVVVDPSVNSRRDLGECSVVLHFQDTCLLFYSGSIDTVCVQNMCIYRCIK
jgi:hypothetical protein